MKHTTGESNVNRNQKSTDKDETLADLLGFSGSARTPDDEPTAMTQLAARLDRVERLQRRSKSGHGLSDAELRIVVKALAAGEEVTDPDELLKQLGQALQAGFWSDCAALCDQLKDHCLQMADAAAESADMRAGSSGRATLTGDTPAAKAGRIEGLFGPGTMPIRSDPTPRRAKQVAGEPIFDATPGLRIKAAGQPRSEPPRENNPLWDAPLRSSFSAARSLMAHIADEAWDRLGR
jgi:hypothetical protein